MKIVKRDIRVVRQEIGSVTFSMDKDDIEHLIYVLEPGTLRRGMRHELYEFFNQAIQES